MRLVAIGCLAGCAAPPAAALSNTAPADVEVPSLEGITFEEGCRLRLDELNAPARIELVPIAQLATDDCPVGFDPAALLAPGGCVSPACNTLAAPAGARTLAVSDHTSGSGRFSTHGVVVPGAVPRAACLMMSTVGWRHLVQVAHLLAPLPLYEDLDGDGAPELIAWQRLPWGSAEITNGLYPVIYRLEADALVRLSTRGSDPAMRTAAAYRALLEDPQALAPDCYRAMLRELEP